MKKIFIIALSTMLLASCATKKSTTLIPRALNTMDVTPLRDLNLTSKDYTIFNTITSEAQITYREKSANYIIIEGENSEFRLIYQFDPKKGWSCKHSGIMKFGFFGSDYEGQPNSFEQPEMICRRLAIYRAINAANEMGADAMVEPNITTNVEQIGKDIVFKSTVTAKLLKLNAK